MIQSEPATQNIPRFFKQRHLDIHSLSTIELDAQNLLDAYIYHRKVMTMIITVVAIYESMLLFYQIKNQRFLVQQLMVAYPTYSADNLSTVLLACLSLDFFINCVMIYVATKTIHSHLTS